MLAVDRSEPGIRRWYVRLSGEEKDFTTVWLTIHQRTLQYETYVLPAPEENHAAVYEQLLRRNLRFNGAAFAIGDEDGIFLKGQIPVDTVTPTSSIASSAPSTPTSSSASGRRCGSASRPASAPPEAPSFRGRGCVRSIRALGSSRSADR